MKITVKIDGEVNIYSINDGELAEYLALLLEKHTNGEVELAAEH